MAAELCLDLPWVPQSPQHVGELKVQRGRRNVLSFDDGIALEVRLLDPAAYPSADALVREAGKEAGPGRVVLIAGSVPVSWRAQIREAELSFIDVSGVADIAWPRLRVVARHFGQLVSRQRSPVPLQKGHGAVAQELLIVTVDGTQPTLAGLAEGAGVSLSTASRAISQLAEHGLVVKKRLGGNVTVAVADRVEIAERLAAQTAWPGGPRLGGYLWGRNIWDVAARLSANATEAGVALAVTGRAGAAFLGVLGTSSSEEVRCWVDAGERSLTAIADSLGLDPAPEEAVNVVLSHDPWRVGVHRRSDISFDDWTAAVAHPVRVWCDLHSEKRGPEFAAQLWGVITHARWPGPGKRLRPPDEQPLARYRCRRPQVIRKRIRRPASRYRRRNGARIARPRSPGGYRAACRYRRSGSALVPAPARRVSTVIRGDDVGAGWGR